MYFRSLIKFLEMQRKLKNQKHGAQCRASFWAEALACWPNPAAKETYVAHVAGTVGTPPTGHRTRHARDGAAAGGGSRDKVSLGRRYEHEQMMVNPPNTERTMKAHWGQLPLVRRVKKAAAVAFRWWGRLWRSKAAVEAPVALKERRESEAWAIQGREGGTDEAHRRGRLAAGGVAQLFDGGE
jgi:hypothetical protein